MKCLKNNNKNCGLSDKNRFFLKLYKVYRAQDTVNVMNKKILFKIF